VGPERYLEYAQRFGFCHPLAIGEGDRALPVDASYVSARTPDGCAPFADRVELANAAYGQAAVQVTPMQMALVAATIANDGVVPSPYVVRDLRTHAANPANGPTDVVQETYHSRGGQPAVSPSVAAEMRAVMIDAVQGPIGQIYAGQGAVTLYGISGVSTAGKTGTAERGPGLSPHSWFIGFAPAQDGATPAIAVAVIVEGSGGGLTLAAPIGGKVMAQWLKLLGG